MLEFISTLSLSNTIQENANQIRVLGKLCFGSKTKC